MDERNEMNMDFLNRIFDSVEEVRKEIVETKIGVANLNGKVKLLSSKMESLATSEELIKTVVELREYSVDTLKTHEKEKHNGRNGSIKINLPLKLASGGILIGGGGTIVYYLLKLVLGF